MSSLHSIGIVHYFSGTGATSGARIKRKAEDFVVQEIAADGRVCGISPILNYDRFMEAREMLERETLSNNDRERRTEIYSKLRYYPFVRAKTREGDICLEKTDVDVYSFVMQKVMFNTVDACRWICRRLEIPPSSIQFAGNKDKRAVTFQEVSVKCSFMKLCRLAAQLKQQEDHFRWDRCVEEGLSKDKIDEADKRVEDEVLKLGSKETDTTEHNAPEDRKTDELARASVVRQSRTPASIKIFDIKKSQPKKIGDLRGNRFTIVLDNLEGTELVGNLERGFLNYYGHQRFGKNLRNHEIGKEILEGNYAGAVDGIIRNSKGYGKYRDGRHEEALELCDSTEKYMLRSRERKVDDRSIILGLQREVKMLYLHSYQSLKFNEALSRRIEMGMDVAVGDLVLVEGKAVRVEDPSMFSIFDVVLELERMNSKMLRGGYRKMVSRAYDVQYEEGDGQVTVSFSLDCSCYATMALREVIGDAVFDGACPDPEALSEEPASRE
jgi:tRNA pseudouridine13 synthase